MTLLDYVSTFISGITETVTSAAADDDQGLIDRKLTVDDNNDNIFSAVAMSSLPPATAVPDSGTFSPRMIGSSLTVGQHVGLVSIATISSLLSLFGSACIFYMASGMDEQFRQRSMNRTNPSGNNNNNNHRTRRRNNTGTGGTSLLGAIRSQKPYHRIMAGMAVADMLFSFCCLLQPWVLPADVTDTPFAIGNFATCSVVGFFFMTFSVVVALYNGSLSINFLLIVVYNWTNEQIHFRMERYVHYVAWIWPLVFMIPATISKSINPEDLTMVCIMDQYPPLCSIEDEVDGEEVSPATGTAQPFIPCTRGLSAERYDPLFLYSLAFVTILGIVCTACVYAKFRRQLRASRRHNFVRRANKESRKQEREERRGRRRSSIIRLQLQQQQEQQQQQRQEQGQLQESASPSKTPQYAAQLDASQVSATTEGIDLDYSTSNNNAPLPMQQQPAPGMDRSSIASSSGDSNSMKLSGLTNQSIASSTRAARRRSSSGPTRSENLTKAVAYRSLFYCLIYINTVIWPLLVKIVANGSDAESADQVSIGVYVMLILSWLFYPLQGFLNLSVYIRPQMFAWRQAAPNASFFTLFGKVLFGETPPRIALASSRYNLSDVSMLNNNNNNNTINNNNTTINTINESNRRSVQMMGGPIPSKPSPSLFGPKASSSPGNRGVDLDTTAEPSRDGTILGLDSDESGSATPMPSGVYDEYDIAAADRIDLTERSSSKDDNSGPEMARERENDERVQDQRHQHQHGRNENNDNGNAFGEDDDEYHFEMIFPPPNMNSSTSRRGGDGGGGGIAPSYLSGQSPHHDGGRDGGSGTRHDTTTTATTSTQGGGRRQQQVSPKGRRQLKTWSVARK